MNAPDIIYNYYSCVVILATVVHFIIFSSGFFRVDSRKEFKDFRNFQGVVLLYFIVDIAWGFLNVTPYTKLLYVDTIFYFLAEALTVVFCCRYIISFLMLDKSIRRVLQGMALLMLVTEVVLLIVNHFHHIVFWLDDDGNYVTYVMRDVINVFLIVIYGGISILALVEAFRSSSVTRGRNITVCFISFCVFIALLVQSLFPLLPMYSVGLIIGFVVSHVFIYSEEQQKQIAETKRLNENLKQEQEELLKQKNEVLTSLAIIRGVSHDYHSIWWANKEDMRMHIVRTGDTVNLGAVEMALNEIDADQAMKMYVEHFVAPGDRERMNSQVSTKKVLKQLESVEHYSINFKRLTRDGGQEYSQMTFSNADTADGRHLLVFGFRDVSDILKQEEELNRERRLRKEIYEAKIAAEQANESKTKFLQNMSHEIRTPLNAMFGFAQLLGLPDGSWTEEEKAQYNAYIYNSYRMLEMLISDIIDIADSEHGNYRIEISDVTINSVCQNSLMSVEYRVPAGVRMYFTTDFDNDYTIRSDERRIQQVLINYLTNACKNTQEGEIHLHCSKTENPGKITFSVTDTGKGIAPDKAKLIFNRFTKLNQFVQGSGLGLNICQIVAKKLNGEVYLDTSYTNGARFVFVVSESVELA